MTTAVATNKLSGKWIGWLTSLLGGLFVAWCFYDPSTPKVNLYWFGTIMAIGMFAFDLLPNFVTAVLLLMYYILTGIAAPDVAFVGWTTPIPWLCMCGMLIGVLMEKTRLANRIALFTISRVGTTPIRMYIAFLLAGFIVSAIIPDVITVDILFMAIATGMCQSLNLSVTSRSATTIVLAAFFGATISSAAYLPNNTGIIGLLMVKDMGVPFTWLGFYSENLPYQIGHALLAYTILHLFGGRELGEHISRCRACAEAELATLGKMSRDEKISAVVLVLCLVLWVSESWHGISAAVVALIGMCILLSTNVMDRKSFRANIAWDATIFIGCSTGLGTVFSKAGITEWVSTSFAPYLEPLFSNIFVLIIASVLIIAILRFAFVSQTALMTIFTVASAPFAIVAGMHPFIPGFIALVTVNVFNTSYHNGTFITTMAASDQMVEVKQVRKMSYVYMAACIIGLICCIPMWKAFGLM